MAAELIKQRTKSKDFDEFAELVKNGLIVNTQLSRGRFQGDVNLVLSPNIMVSNFHFNTRLMQQGISAPGYVTFLFWSQESSLCWRYSNLSNNHVAVLWRNEHHAITSANFEGMPISIKEDWLVAKCLEKGFEPLLDAIEKHCIFKVSTQNIVKIHNFVRKAFKYNWNTNLFEETTIDLLLDCFDPSFKASIFKASIISSKEIIEFIYQHQDTIDQVNQLSEAFNISERAIRYRLTKDLNLSPKDLIKSVKLNRIRHNIKHNFNADSINSIANEFGLWHMGQFSADFKRHFGYLPSELIHFC